MYIILIYSLECIKIVQMDNPDNPDYPDNCPDYPDNPDNPDYPDYPNCPDGQFLYILNCKLSISVQDLFFFRLLMYHMKKKKFE
jgi:hypothetical protein